MAITPRDCVPRDWTLKLTGGPIGLGLDLATTDKQTSNPSSLTVTEQTGPLYVQRLVVRWKTSKESVTRAIVAVVFADIAMAKRRPKRLSIDGSNERFFAQRLQKQFSKYCPIEVVVASETTEYQGESFDMKTLLGNLYVNDMAEGKTRMPNVAWLKDDHRLVKKRGGRFVADTSPNGGHADTFDSGKLARWSLQGTGRAEIAGASVGGLPGGKTPLPQGLKNPFLKQLRRPTPHA